MSLVLGAEETMAEVTTRVPKVDSHSFVIRIWLEETAEEAGKATWRGHITHVPSGDRHYFECIPEMVSYMTPYLEEMGVSSPSPSALVAKVRCWLRRWLR